MGTTPPARRHVFDAGHTLLGSFDDAETAHRFAHRTSLEPHARLPLEVADPAERVSRFVWPDRCLSVRWLAVAGDRACTFTPLRPAGRLTAVLGVLPGRGAPTTRPPGTAATAPADRRQTWSDTQPGTAPPREQQASGPSSTEAGSRHVGEAGEADDRADRRRPADLAMDPPTHNFDQETGRRNGRHSGRSDAHFHDLKRDSSQNLRQNQSQRPSTAGRAPLAGPGRAAS